MEHDIDEAMIEALVAGFVKQKPNRRMTLQDAANELDWLREHLRSLIAAVRRDCGQ